jgi:uncharacterized UBP type Zn finger protein
MILRVPLKADPFDPEPMVDLCDLLDARMSRSVVPEKSCQKCGYRGEFHEYPQFTHLPRVLIIEIDRVANGRFGVARLDNPLNFPEVLDMARCPNNLGSDAAITYQLKAVVRHYTWTEASGERKGHFTAFIRIESSTYCFDDKAVAKSDWGDQGAVSLLIYERR